MGSSLLDGHIKRAIAILEAMIDENSDDEDMDFLVLWDNNPDVIESVKKQIEQLKKLLPESKK